MRGGGRFLDVLACTGGANSSGLRSDFGVSARILSPSNCYCVVPEGACSGLLWSPNEIMLDTHSYGTDLDLRFPLKNHRVD